MKNIVAVFILLFCVGVTFVYFMQNKKHQELFKLLSDLQYGYRQKMESQAFKLATLKEDMNTCYINEGYSLKANMILLEEGKEKANLAHLVKNKTLIVRLSQMNCQACIMAFTPLLQELKDCRVIFFMDYTNKRYIQEFKKSYIIGDYRFFKVEFLPIPLDTLNIPYFFLLDRNLKTECVFIPHKEMINQTEKYLEIIKNRITSK